MNSALLLLVCVFIACASATSAPPCDSFGVAGNYRLFALGHIYGCNSDVQGPIAAGSGITLSNYGVGETWTPASDYAILSAGPISYHSGSVNNGAILGSSVTDITNVNIVNQGVNYISSECCTVEGCGACSAGASPIDFAVAKTDLENLSDLWGSWITTIGATIVEEYGNIQLTCYGSGPNVFSGVRLTEDNNEININCAAGQSVLINYSDDTTGIPSGFGTNLRGGVTSNTIIHHFGRAHTSVSVSSTQGTIFAPFATLHFAHGLIVGDVIVNNFGTAGSCNGGQINLSPCDACFPSDGDVKYCCLYENGSYHFSYTNAFCSTLPCNHIFFPHWDLVGQYTTPDCHQCCFPA